MMKSLLIGLSINFLLGACQTTKNTERLVIASERADCTGVMPMKCLVVKKEGEKDWEFFYNNIEGFNYEPGYEYVIEVRKDAVAMPTADQSSLHYRLVKEISKKQKQSENLPSGRR